MDDRQQRRIDRNQAFIEGLQREAEGLPEGSERQKRYAALTLCQIARGDALTKLMIADNLLDEARKAVDDPSLPCVMFGRIPKPDFVRQQEDAQLIRDAMERATEKVLVPRMTRWLKAWISFSGWLRGRNDWGQ